MQTCVTKLTSRCPELQAKHQNNVDCKINHGSMNCGRSKTSMSSTASGGCIFRTGTVKRIDRFPGRTSAHVCPSRRMNFSAPGRMSFCLMPCAYSIDRSCPHIGKLSHGVSGFGIPQSSNSKGELTGSPVAESTKSRQYSAAEIDPGNSRTEYLESGIGRMKTDLSPVPNSPGLICSRHSVSVHGKHSATRVPRLVRHRRHKTSSRLS